MRQLTMSGKSLNFETLHISTILYISLDVQSSTTAQLDKAQKQFIWRNVYPRLKNASLCNDYGKTEFAKFLRAPFLQDTS